ncbi:MAG: YfcC family protein [Gemmatimonadales bacterium]
MAKIRLPHSLTLLVACILLAAGLTHILPAGEFQRHTDPTTGRSIVIAGTYAHVEAKPVGPFETFIAIPRGITDAASVIGLIFLVGGAFAVVEKAGTLGRLVQWLVGKLANRGAMVIPIASVVFALGGITEHTSEELIAFVPALLLLARTLGFTPLTIVAMSLGSAAIGSAFGPVDPFSVLIAQRLTQLTPGSGLGFRMLFLVPALVIWTWGTMRYAARTRIAPSVAGGEAVSTSLEPRDVVIVLAIGGALALYVYGAQRLDWEFDQLSALLFAVGILAGLLGRLGLDGTAEAFVDGFRSMAYAGLLVGFARAIYVVLSEGKIVDTIVNGLFSPINGLPPALSAIGMMLAHTVIHFPVPSSSGQAVLTLPLLVPLSDLIGLSRQVTVLAYQYGNGLCEVLTPTNGALVAMLAAAGVRYEEWLRFALPLWLLLAALGALAIVVGVATGLR